MRNPDKERLLLDEGFQILAGVITALLVVGLFFGGMVLRGHLNDQRDDATEKELVGSCLEHDTIALQESCVLAYLRMKGEDPTTRRIEDLQDQISELQAN